MARRARKRGRRRPQGRAARLVSPVSEMDAAGYVFDLIRSVLAITRDYNDFRLATYFLEMAALELAPRLRSHAAEPRAHESSRTTS